MHTYSTSAKFIGSTDSVLSNALAILTVNGFLIVNRDTNSADLTGPGLNSTRQNPLLGASRIHLEIAEQQIRLDAELGGVKSMQNFIMRFPIGLGLGLGLLFAVGGGTLFGQLFGVGFGMPGFVGWKWLLLAMGIPLLSVSPWLFLSPKMSEGIATRTQDALSALVRNAISMQNPI